ncbi:VanW family protein [Candidatus Oleimmundimicrobium sp.]|uniref:VanW family protein n=1 Tax=Candidatus Oleimmundimicrobium sp. TaxID=3060597 RepID=UPI00271E2839|nr:VanW family protein [Candidatus Oleimmundimicrobium sp.]MDO8885317.1 VanW family protein [Candidatus Oleimmundimicrobium sp.]
MDILKAIKLFKIKNFFKANKKTIVVLAASIIMLVALPTLADAVIHYGKIHHGIKINGINVGYLTPQESQKKVSQEMEHVLSKSVIVQHENMEWKLTPTDIKTNLNVAKSVEKAYNVGRKGGFISCFKIRFLTWFSPIESPLICYTDSRLINSFINNIAKEVDKEPRDAGLEINGTDIEVIKSQIGIKVKKTDLFSQIKDKVVSLENRKINLPTSISPAVVADDGVEQAKADLVKMLQASLILKYSDKRWEVGPEKIGELVAFNKTDEFFNERKKVVLKAALDKEKVESYIKEVTQDISKKAEDAKFEIIGKKVKIIPSVDGNKIDTAVAYLEIEKVIKSNPPREIILKMKTVKPDLATEEAQAMGIKERVSVFKTYYSAGNAPRVNNIHLLAGTLDEMLVAPGEIFSFNEFVGPRTTEKGYQEAGTIINGEVVPTIGGGVCQVGTTIFNTAFFGGYPIIERSNHSFYISKYPTGRDATVSYGGPDFRFKNDTSAHILIKTSYSNSSVTVSFYSTGFGINVSYDTSQFSNIVSCPIEYVEDSTINKGEQKIEEQGINGFDVTVYRTVTKNGETIRKDKFFSRYKPKKAVILIGTKDNFEQEEDGAVPKDYEETTSTA